MDYFELPHVYSEMLKELDKQGIDYLTLLETKDNQWYVEGYVIIADPSLQGEIRQRLSLIVERFGLSIKEQETGIVICSTQSKISKG